MWTCQTALKIVQIIMEMPVKKAAFPDFSKCGFDKSKNFSTCLSCTLHPQNPWTNHSLWNHVVKIKKNDKGI